MIRQTVLNAYQKQQNWREEAIKMDEQMTKQATNFEIFEDRVKSLLERWSKFEKEHPEYPSANIVKVCVAEIDDGFTKQLME